MARDLAIDLGAAGTRVWARGRGLVVDEPTVVAVTERTGKVLAMGRDAYDRVAADPSVVVDRPLRTGAVTDYGVIHALLRLVLARAGATRLARPRLLLCVPSAVNDLERRAVQEAAADAGAAAVHLMEEPLAVAIGAQLPIAEPVGVLSVAIGAATTSAAVLSMGGVVTSTTVRVGGYHLDAAIAAHVRRDHGIAVGERTAEQLKLALGSAKPTPERERAEVAGRDLSTGLARTAVVSAAELREATEATTRRILSAIIDTLADCPPDLTHDVLDGGLWLAGGGAQLSGLAERLRAETGSHARVVEDPVHAVVTGAGRSIETLDALRLAFDDR